MSLNLTESWDHRIWWWKILTYFLAHSPESLLSSEFSQARSRIDLKVKNGKTPTFCIYWYNGEAPYSQGKTSCQRNIFSDIYVKSTYILSMPLWESIFMRSQACFRYLNAYLSIYLANLYTFTFLSSHLRLIQIKCSRWENTFNMSKYLALYS